MRNDWHWRKLVVGMLIATLMAGSSSLALAMTGQEVIDKVKEVYGGFNSLVVNLTSQCFEGERKINERQLILVSENRADDVTVSILQFLSPADVKGTGLLDLGEDQMYMYLPEFHKVRRIAGSAKNGSFMGTDFTYNDLSLINYDTSDYHAELVKEDNENYLLELTAKEKKDQDYDRLVMTVRKEDFFPVKVEFYDKDTKKLRKVLTAYEPTAYGKYRFPKKLMMTDVTTNHKTVIFIDKPEFDRELAGDTFSERNLKRSKLRY